jgi:hypothetical protein
MMDMIFMDMKLVKVEGKTKEDLCNALRELAKLDDDFNGNNGIDYLWEEVDSSKYQSNIDYLLDNLIGNTDKELIEDFVKCWIEEDSYYVDYKLQVLYDKDNKAECIALALLSRC